MRVFFLYSRSSTKKKRSSASVCLMMGEVSSESAVAVMVTLPKACVMVLGMVMTRSTAPLCTGSDPKPPVMVWLTGLRNPPWMVTL